jgi:TPR repeat protein
MNILKIFTKIFLVILICLTTKISFADFETGLKAFNDGKYENALQIWEPLAKDGLSNAQYNLGLMHHNGLGTTQDYKQAYYWLLLSSEQGNLNSIRLISTLYALGNGVKKDYLKSYMWAKIGADNDDQNSKIMLDGLLKEMNGSEINKANEMVQVCNDKNFKGC